LEISKPFNCQSQSASSLKLIEDSEWNETEESVAHITDNTHISISVNSFFLDADSYGKNRASCTVQYLLDLNVDVYGEAIEEHPETLLKQNPGFFNQYSCVIGSQLSER